MMFVFSDLFIVKDGKIATYRYDFDNHTLQVRPKDGEQWQPLTDDFWTWWADAVNFVPEEYLIDMAILSDTNPSLLAIPENYRKVDVTQWTPSLLRTCCDKLFPNEEAEFYEGEALAYKIQNGISRTHQKYFFTRFNVPNSDTLRELHRKKTMNNDAFIQYLAGDDLPEIILKDVIR